MIKDKILKNYIQALKKIGISDSQAFLEDPKYFNFGDYSGTAPLKFSKQLSKNPISIAKDIKNNFEPTYEIPEKSKTRVRDLKNYPRKLKM